MGAKNLLWKDLTIDLGSSHTVLASRRQRFFFRDKTRILLASDFPARNSRANPVLAFGAESLSLAAPRGVRAEVHAPIERGRLANPTAMDLLLHALLGHIRRAARFSLSLGRESAVVLPPGLSAAERFAFKALLDNVGLAAQVIEAPLAAAHACGFNPGDREGRMLVEVGGGKSYAAMFTLGEVVAQYGCPFGGEDLDAVLSHYIEQRHRLTLPIAAPEAIKLAIGSVYPRVRPETLTVAGTDTRSGFEKKVLLDDNEVRDVLIDACEPLVLAIQHCLADMPAELAADIERNGVVLVGGGSLLEGFPEFLSERVGLAFHRAEDPLDATILGAQALLCEGKL